MGFGPGGRIFHAPFIEAAEGLELCGVVTRSPERRAEVERRHGVPVYASLAEMLEAEPGMQAVTITTPPDTRRELVLEALAAGRHVLSDKPFAPTAEAGRELARAAADAGLLLSVFHNRRWDADLLTLASVIEDGRLGDVWRIDSRFDVDEAHTIDSGPDGGLLRDLGVHLIDQMRWLLGSVDSVDAHLDWIDRPEGLTDANFAVTMHHSCGAVSRVTGSKMNGRIQRELAAYGSGGSFVSSSNDQQTADVIAGVRPVDDPSGWGYEREENWGVLAAPGVAEVVPSAQGSWFAPYEQFGAAIRGEGEVPVDLDGAIETIALLDAARLSAETGRRIHLTEDRPPPRQTCRERTS